jgi:hypothetical protein
VELKGSRLVGSVEKPPASRVQHGCTGSHDCDSYITIGLCQPSMTDAAGAHAPLCLQRLCCVVLPVLCSFLGPDRIDFSKTRAAN